MRCVEMTDARPSREAKCQQLTKASSVPDSLGGLLSGGRDSSKLSNNQDK